MVLRYVRRGTLRCAARPRNGFSLGCRYAPRSMPVCAKCGHANPEGSRFCNACAAPLETAPGPSATPSVQEALDRLHTDESGLDEEAEDEAEGVQDLGRDPSDAGVYVRWQGWPFSTLRTTEQTAGQFMVTSVFGFVVLGLMLVIFAVAGLAVCGVLLAIVVVALWFIQWRVGREGAMYGA